MLVFFLRVTKHRNNKDEINEIYLFNRIKKFIFIHC